MATISAKAHQWLILAIVNLTVPGMAIWSHMGQAGRGPALVIAFLSLLALNTVVLVASWLRDKRVGSRLTPKGYFLGAFCLAVLSGLLSAVAIRSEPERNDYIDLALSDTPLDEIHPKQKALVVELIRRNAFASSQYEQLAARTKTVSPSLYSPESFANEDVIRSVAGQYKKAFDVDVTYHMQVQRNWNEFREKMQQTDPTYLKSFEPSTETSNEEDERVFELLSRCASSTLALYDYAEKHSKQISVAAGEIRFANQDVQINFNQRLQESKSLDQQMESAFQNLHSKRLRTRKSSGISPNARDWQ